MKIRITSIVLIFIMIISSTVTFAEKGNLSNGNQDVEFVKNTTANGNLL